MHSRYSRHWGWALLLLAGCSVDSGTAAVSAAQSKAREAQDAANVRQQVVQQLEAAQARHAQQLQASGEKQ